MLFFLAIIIGLLINYFTGGLEFNTALCFFVGIFLIMPILLKINFKDIKEIFYNKKILAIDLILNFLIIPLIAFIIGYLVFGPENYGFIVSLLLVAIIPGGGLLMSWLQNTKSNMHIGFTLFAINLLFFSGFYILFNFQVEKFVENHQQKQEISKTIENIKPSQNPAISPNHLLPTNTISNLINKQEEKQTGCAIEQVSEKIGLSSPSCFETKSTMIYGFFGFIALILIPFILSRIILLFAKPESKIFKLAPKFSKISAFILITYIFSLNYVRGLFDVNINLILKISLAVVLFYIALFIVLKLFLSFFQLKEDIKKAIFWNSYTRFLTLSLILSFLYAISWKQPEIILVPIISYFVQIASASFLARKK